jgi:tetratricopeptide (TPR) repeat protein
VSARCVRAGILVLADDKPADRELARELAIIAALHSQATDRDRAHAHAARAWLEGDARRAAKGYGDILEQYPRDILALQIAHSLDLRLGSTELLRDRIAKVLPYWHESLPGFGCVLTMHAFGLQENESCEEAVSVAQRALAVTPGNPGAIHVIAHVLHRQKRAADGLRWLRETLPHWGDGSAFSVHNAWHWALCHLALGQPDAALAIYDERIRKTGEVSASALVDASALLWRLSLRGLDLQERWNELADQWEDKVHDQRRIFNSVHALMACAAVHRERSVARIMKLVRDPKLQRTTVRADMSLALPVCLGLQAFCRGSYAQAVAQFKRVGKLAQRCGGSVAQCDLVELTLREALSRVQHGAGTGRVRAHDRGRRQWIWPFIRPHAGHESAGA